MATAMKTLLLFVAIVSNALVHGMSDHFADYEALLLSRMNLSADPCNDFYNYACGGANENLYDVHSDNYRWVYRGFKKLTNPAYNGKLLQSTAIANAVKYLDLCEKTWEDKNGHEVFTEFINIFTAKFNVPYNLFESGPELTIDIERKAQMLFHASDKFMVEPFFGVKGRILGESNLQLNISKPELSFRVSEYTCENRDNLMKKFVDSVSYMRTILVPKNVTKRSIEIIAKKFMDIEFRLHDVRCDGDDYDVYIDNAFRNSMRLTVNELKYYGRYTAVGRFVEVFVQTLNKEYNLNISLTNFTIETTPEDVIALNDAAHNISDTDFLQYLYFRSINSLIKHFPQGKCVTFLKPLPLIRSRIYTEFKYKTDEEREAVRDLVTHFIDNIKNTLINMIESTLFVNNDETTVPEITNVFHNMTFDVLYNEKVFNNTWLDDYYKPLNFTQDDDFYSMHYKVMRFVEYGNKIHGLRQFDNPEVNDYSEYNSVYMPMKNKLAIFDGALVPPFYHPEYPYSFTFGSIGSIIGNKFAHVFDWGAVFRDLKYWSHVNVSKETLKNVYENVLEMNNCLYDQYSEFDFPWDSFGVIVEENMADISGVEAAYRAFKNVSGRQLSEHGLHGTKLDRLTPDQQFFLGYAGHFCQQALGESIAAELGKKTNSNVTRAARLVGTLSNIQGFEEAFQCPGMSNYVAEYRCTAWNNYKL